MLSGDIEAYLKKLDREIEYLRRVILEQSQRIDYLEGPNREILRQERQARRNSSILREEDGGSNLFPRGGPDD